MDKLLARRAILPARDHSSGDSAADLFSFWSPPDCFGQNPLASIRAREFRPKTSAGELLSTDKEPEGWTGRGLLKHDFTVKFDCVDFKNKPKPVIISNPK